MLNSKLGGEVKNVFKLNYLEFIFCFSVSSILFKTKTTNIKKYIYIYIFFFSVTKS